MFYTPISPSGDFDSLCTAVHRVNPHLAVGQSGTKLDTPEFSSYDVNITSSFVSAEVMANIGFKGLVIGGDAKATYFLLDIIATQPVAVPLNSGQGLNIWGVGGRIAFASSQVSGDAAFSVSGLAASAVANGSAVMLQATVIGGGALNDIKFFNSGIASFDQTSASGLGEGVNELFRVMTNPNNMDSFQPNVIGIVPESQVPQQSFAVSYEYGLRAINKGWNLPKALDRAPVDVPSSLNVTGSGFAVDSNVIQGIYESLGVSGDDNPSSQQRSKAGDLYDCGP